MKQYETMMKKHYYFIQEIIEQAQRVYAGAADDARYEAKKLHLLVSQLLKTAEKLSACKPTEAEEKAIFEQMQQQMVAFFEMQIDAIEGVI